LQIFYILFFWDNQGIGVPSPVFRVVGFQPVAFAWNRARSRIIWFRFVHLGV